MSSDPQSHWSSTAYRLTVVTIPATFFIPIFILPFFHPLWFVILSLTWMAATYYLGTKGLGIKGLGVILRRLLQGNTLRQRNQFRR